MTKNKAALADHSEDHFSGSLRVLVCGGRDYDDADMVCAVLDRIHRQHGIVRLIEGGARGADALARRWALSDPESGPWIDTYPADWKGLGAKAGPVRNKRMLDEGKPDLVVAFPGGRGTAHMTRIAREAGVKVIEIAAAEAAHG